MGAVHTNTWVVVGIVYDSSNQCKHILERASANAFVGKLAKPTLDQEQHVDPL
jgi:hypothetical protein